MTPGGKNVKKEILSRDLELHCLPWSDHQYDEMRMVIMIVMRMRILVFHTLHNFSLCIIRFILSYMKAEREGR